MGTYKHNNMWNSGNESTLSIISPFFLEEKVLHKGHILVPRFSNTSLGAGRNSLEVNLTLETLLVRLYG